MTSPNNPAVVYVSLGSNIAPEHHLRQAVRMLRTHSPLLVISSVYRTPPQGFTQQPDFLNMAVRLITTLSPVEFKARVIGSIEQRLSRVRDPHNKNAPRTIDLDISLWNQDVMDYGDKPWHIPEPDITRFAHVAMPLAEIAPDYVHPETGQTLAQIAAQFDTSAMQREKLNFMDDSYFVINIEGAIWHEGRYLTIIRGAEESHAAGTLSFVGGKVETGATQENTIFENTLRCEIREEVGLEIESPTYVESRMFRAGAGEPVINIVFVCRYQSGSVTITDPGEVAGFEWLTPAEIRAHPSTPPWILDYLASIEQVRAQLGW
jgi:2-amino-4-hydroxy-6-hydroxymethyldihydropteridine diphosphokinase